MILYFGLTFDNLVKNSYFVDVESFVPPEPFKPIVFFTFQNLVFVDQHTDLHDVNCHKDVGNNAENIEEEIGVE
jgi:hypothetical protein